MPTPIELAQKHAHFPKGETIAEAALRAATYAREMISAGHEEFLTERLAEMRLDEDDELSNLGKAMKALALPKPTTEAVATLERAEKRFGAKLPAGVRELWSVLGSPGFGIWLRGFCKHSLINPAQLLSSKGGAGAKLSCPVDEDGNYSDTRDRFDDEYQEWFEESDAKDRISSAKDLASRKSSADGGDGGMLDPKLRDSIITIAHWHSEHWFVVADLASPKTPAPVFSNHDEEEGYSGYLAPDVATWLSQEVSLTMKAVAEDDDDE